MTTRCWKPPGSRNRAAALASAAGVSAAPAGTAAPAAVATARAVPARIGMTRSIATSEGPPARAGAARAVVCRRRAAAPPTLGLAGPQRQCLLRNSDRGGPRGAQLRQPCGGQRLRLLVGPGEQHRDGLMVDERRGD